MNKILLLLLTIFTLPQLTHAQRFLDRLEQRTKDKINNKIDQKVDEKVDKGLDKAFGIEQEHESDSSISDSARSIRLARRLMGKQFSTCTPKSSYSYTSKAIMDIYGEGKGKNDSFSMRYYWYMNANSENMAMEMIPLSEKMQSIKGSKTIIDMKDSCIVTLMNQNGTKMMMTMKYGETDYSEYIDTSEYQRPVKTSKTKTINGKLCHEYVLDNKENYQQMWIESSKTALWDQNLKNWKATSDPFKNSADIGQFFDYYPLEIMTKDKKSKMVTTIFVRSVVKKSTTISTSGYTQF